MIVKEFGSDFHLCFDSKFSSAEKENVFINDEAFALFFSGRAALYSLLQFGSANFGWKRVYFPSYYCHEVVCFMQGLPLETLYYQFNPFLDHEEKDIDVEDDKENVLINASFFGLKKLKLASYNKAVVIDDVTHDIMAFRDSNADYCFGSFRKILPVPCGGFCFAGSKELPRAEYTVESEKVAFQKTTAMYLKAEYLEGRFNQKDYFRNQFMDAEMKFADDYTQAAIPSVAKAILAQFDIENIRKKKRENLNFALSRLKSNPAISYNLDLDGIEPLGLLLKMSNPNERASLKAFLVSNNIYPAILWPNQVFERDIESSNATLFLHMDYRYDLAGIEYITDTLNRYISE